MAKPFSTFLTVTIGLSIGALLMLGLADPGIGKEAPPSNMLAQLQMEPVSPLTPSAPDQDTSNPFDQDEPADIDPLLNDDPVVTETPETSELQIVEVVNSMAQSMYDVMRDDAVNPRDDGSFLYSPLVATYQLGIMSAGGNDVTRSEVAATLGTSAPAAEIGQAIQEIAPIIHPVEYRLGVSASSAASYGGALRIEAVADGSTAAALRLKPGDYIVAVNGKLVSSTEEFNEQVSLSGGKVALHVFKSGPGTTVVYDVDIFPNDPARICGATFYAPNDPLSDSYRTEMDENFFVDMLEADFNHNGLAKEAVRQWIQLGSGGQVPYVESPHNPAVEPDSTSSLVGMAALYGNWENPVYIHSKLLGFETLRGNIQSVSACYTEGEINCALGDRITAVELPLRNSPLSVVLIKPANLSALHDFEQVIVADGFAELKEQMRKKPIRIRMPLLNLSMLIDYKKVFETIGVKNPFESTDSMSSMFADGTGKIGHVLQESRMRIWGGEKPTLGDGMIAGDGMAKGPVVNINPKPERLITFNRYFIIYIYDRSTDATWFVGRVAKIDEGHAWGVEEAAEQEQVAEVKAIDTADETPETTDATPVEDTTETPEATTVDTPGDDSVQTPTEDATEAPAEDTVETPAEEPIEVPTEVLAEEPVEEAPVEVPAEDPVPAAAEEAPAEVPAEDASEAPATDPFVDPAEVPAPEPITQPAEAPAADPFAEPVDTPVVPPAFDPGETSTEAVN